MNFGSIENEKNIDWGKTSEDYARYRPGPPASLYEKLAVLGVGLKGQRILDLGTGTGLLARNFSRRGAVVSGIDSVSAQIASAEKLAHKENLSVTFKTAPAEKIPFDADSFEIVAASQCWFYFKQPQTIEEVRRVLVRGGLLVTTHFSYMPRMDKVAQATEMLILKFNPEWTAADLSCEIPAHPKWAQKDFNVRAMFYYDVPVRFTRESWRGRMRACRGVSAQLPPGDVERFDKEHQALLERIAPEEFTVLHRIDAHIFEFKNH